MIVCPPLRANSVSAPAMRGLNALQIIWLRQEAEIVPPAFMRIGGQIGIIFTFRPVDMGLAAP